MPATVVPQSNRLYHHFAMLAETEASPDPDRSLYERLHERRDEAALHLLVQRHWDRAFRIAWRVLRDPSLAEDAAQQAMIALARDRTWRGEGSLASWIARIVVNEARKIARGAMRRAAREAIVGAARSEGGGRGGDRDDSELAIAVDAELSRLPDDLRIPLALHFQEGLTHVEVAATLGIATGTASSRLRRGLDRLRVALEAAGLAAAIPDFDSTLVRALLRAPAPPKAPPAPSAAALLAKAAATSSIGLGALLGAGAGVLALAAIATIMTLGPARLRPHLSPTPTLALGGSSAEGAARALAGRGKSDSAEPPSDVGNHDATGGDRTGAAAGRDSAGARAGGASSDAPSKGIFHVRAIDTRGAPVARALVLFELATDRDGAHARAEGVGAKAGLTEQRFRASYLGKIREGSRPALGTTDANGLVALPVVEERHDIDVVLAARCGTLAGVMVRPLESFYEEEVGKNPITLTLRRPGEPLPGCGAILVRAHPEGVTVPASAIRFFARPLESGDAEGLVGLDAEGRIAFPDLLPGNYRVATLGTSGVAYAFRDGVRVEAGAVAEVDLAVSPEATLSGRVLASDGTPIATAEVYLEGSRSNLTDPPGEPAKEGSFLIDEIPPGHYVLTAHASGFAGEPGARVELDIDGPGPHQAPDLVFPNGALVVARLKRGTGAPAAGVDAYLVRDDDGHGYMNISDEWMCISRHMKRPGPDASDAEGRVRFRSATAGRWKLLVFGTARDHHQSIPVVVPEDATVVDVPDVVVDAGDLAAPGRLSGHAIDPDGKPLVGARIKIDSASQASDDVIVDSGADGAFARANLAPGEYVVSGYAGSLAAPAVRVTVAEGEEACADIAFERTGSIVGEVHLPPGGDRGVVMISAILLSTRSRSSPPSIPDADGRFHLENLLPGEYRVEACVGSNQVTFGRVTVKPGEEAGPIVYPPARSRSLGGNVIGLDRLPQQHPPLFAILGRGRLEEAGEDPPAQVPVGPDGSFTFDSVPPGPATVVVPIGAEGDVWRLIFRELDDAAAAGSVSLEVPAGGPAGAIDGHVKAGEKSIAAIGAGYLATAKAGSDGAFAIEGLPPGRYRLFCAATEGPPKPTGVEVEVRAGERAKAELGNR